jgi:8-oxo-dGTP diphosphatase
MAITSSREFPLRPIVGVGAIILHDNRILLVKRGTPPLEGEWSLPGGAQELGETLEHAIIREVREETALFIEPVKQVAVFDRMVHDDRGEVRFHYVLIDFLCRIQSGAGFDATAGSDVLDVCWTESGELASLGVADWTQQVIQKAISSMDKTAG